MARTMPPAARFANTVRRRNASEMTCARGARPHTIRPMRIACPACNAAYDVPDRLIGTGRRLRCARCGHDWEVQQPAVPGASAADGPARPPIGRAQARLQAPPGPEPEAPPAPDLPPPPPHSALRRAPQVLDQEAPPRPGGDGAASPLRFLDGLWAAWAASILVVLAFLAALLVFRAEIAAAWPPAARLYIALGLDTAGG